MPLRCAACDVPIRSFASARCPAGCSSSIPPLKVQRVDAPVDRHSGYGFVQGSAAFVALQLTGARLKAERKAFPDKLFCFLGTHQPSRALVVSAGVASNGRRGKAYRHLAVTQPAPDKTMEQVEVSGLLVGQGTEQQV